MNCNLEFWLILSPLAKIIQGGTWRMLKSCFENWIFGYLPGLCSRLYCTRNKIVWENLEKLNDGGLLPGLLCEQKNHPNCRGISYPLWRIHLDLDFTPTVWDTLLFYSLQPFYRATFLLKVKRMLLFHFLCHCLCNQMWQVLVFVCLKGLFVFLKKHFPFILVFLPPESNIWNHPGNNSLTSIKLPSLRAQREADAGGRKSGCDAPSLSAVCNNTYPVPLVLPWKINSHVSLHENPGNDEFESNKQSLKALEVTENEWKLSLSLNSHLSVLAHHTGKQRCAMLPSDITFCQLALCAREFAT